eukprot:sb/3469941/
MIPPEGTMGGSVAASYIAEMQNINKDCQQQKNLGLCTDPMASIGITDEFVTVMTTLNRHCDECEAELMGIRDNCTVFLPHEARMSFSYKYEAEQQRKDLNSNPCFKGFMSPFANQCSEECSAEVDKMNEARVLSCFDALVRYSHTALPEWQLWHRSCVKDRGIKINNYINATFILGGPLKIVPKRDYIFSGFQVRMDSLSSSFHPVIWVSIRLFVSR